jgi:phage-related minor tail protein
MLHSLSLLAQTHWSAPNCEEVIAALAEYMRSGGTAEETGKQSLARIFLKYLASRMRLASIIKEAAAADYASNDKAHPTIDRSNLPD